MYILILYTGATLDAEAQGMLAVTVVASDSVIAPNTRSSTVMCSPSNSSLTSNNGRPLTGGAVGGSVGFE